LSNLFFVTSKPEDKDSKADVRYNFSGEYKTGKADIKAMSTDSDSDGAKTSPFALKTFSEKVRLIYCIYFGDFVHNLCDGFFVGAVFNECSDSMAWGVTIAPIIHELPQELSDYLILIGP
jgi:zinc transporter ZupT